jgi:HK97 family phage major capsid protein
MRLSDALKGKRAEILDAMEKMAKATETDGRLFTSDEQATWEKLTVEINDIDRKIAAQEQAERLLRGDTTGRAITPAGVPRLIDDQGNVVRALTLKDKLADALPHRTVTAPAEVSTARVLRGVVLGDWQGASRLERAVGESATSTQLFPVPEYISSTWLDNARAASVAMQAGAITVPMRSMTEKIVRTVGDPTATFRKEHAPIPESDIIFSPLTLKARLVGVLVRVSIELLEDSPIAESMIEAAITGAIAAKIDWALLAGDGSTTGDLDNPTGLINTAGINTQTGTSPITSYDPFVDAIGKVMAFNGVPNAIIGGPGLAVAANKVKTGLSGDQSILLPPPMIVDLEKYYTSQLPNTTAVLGDFSMLAMGLRTSLTLEATRTGGNNTFANAQVLVRAYMRMDTGVLRPSWFTKITGLPTGELVEAPAPEAAPAGQAAAPNGRRAAQAA